MIYRASKNELDRANLIMSDIDPKENYSTNSTIPPKSIFLNNFARAQEFERDYPSFLLSLASSVRTGKDPLQAIIDLIKLFDAKSVLRIELENLRILIESGVSEDQALIQFGNSVNHPDIALFRTAYMLSRKQGSSLGESLQRLVKVTRHRQSFRRKVRSAVAMQKLSAFGIAGCAVLICLIQIAGNPKIINDALSSPTGQKLLLTGALLILTGLIWMLKMTKTKI